MTPLQGLQLRVLIRADHVLVGTELDTVPLSLVQVQHSACLGREVRVAGKVHDRCCHGLIASAANHRPIVEVPPDEPTQSPRRGS